MAAGGPGFSTAMDPDLRQEGGAARAAAASYTRFAEPVGAQAKTDQNRPEPARQRKNRVAELAGARHVVLMTLLMKPLDERCVAYARMADALEHLGETWRDWPDLRTCAEAVGLSASHFQREFTRWAGISPKQYQAVSYTHLRAPRD